MRTLFLVLLLCSPLYAQDWHDTAEDGKLPALQQALAANPALLNARDDEGETALMEAAEEGHLEVVRWLLSQGARVDLQDDDGETALMEAAEEGHEDMVRLLLRSGSPIGTRDRHLRSALDKAKSPEIRELLRARGAR